MSHIFNEDFFSSLLYGNKRAKIKKAKIEAQKTCEDASDYVNQE